MIVHIILLFYICMLAFALYGKGVVSRKRNKIFLWLAFTGIFFVEALRGPSVGLDTANYVRGFDILANNITTGEYAYTANHWETGWRLINKLIGVFTKDPQWLIAMASLIICVGIAIFIYYNLEENESAFWPVFFFITLSYLFPSSMNLMRQYCAMAIAVNIYTILRKEVTKKNIILSLFLLFCAFEIHRTAILYGIVLFFCCIKRLSRSHIICCCVAGVGAYLLFDFLVNLWICIQPSAAVYVAPDNAYYAGFEFSAYTAVMCAMRLVFMLLVFILNPKVETNQDLYYLSIFNIVAAIFSILTVKTALAVRMGYYFEIFIIFIIPKLIDRLRDMKRTVYLVTFYLGWAFYFFELFHGAKGTVPYTFFWQ